MTLGAQPRVSNFQQSVIDRAVGLVAVSTTFERGWMLIKKWAAPLGMAGVTVLVDTGLLELGGIRRAVRIVAVSTG